MKVMINRVAMTEPNILPLLSPSKRRYFKEEKGVLWSRYLTIITEWHYLDYHLKQAVKHLTLPVMIFLAGILVIYLIFL
jgi:hypothetical protein